jgi:hypothetical protein
MKEGDEEEAQYLQAVTSAEEKKEGHQCPERWGGNSMDTNGPKTRGGNCVTWAILLCAQRLWVCSVPPASGRVIHPHGRLI